MRLKFCAVCGTTNDLHQHHISPRVYQETYDKTTNWDDGCITLCSFHHRMIHGINKRFNHKTLTEEGLRRAKESGVQMGRPIKVNQQMKDGILASLDTGVSVSQTARDFKVARNTVLKVRRERN